MSEWQPIETAPKDRPILLVSKEDPHNVQMCEWDRDVWLSPYADTTFFSDPTHWMPLPEPPKP